MTDDHSPLDDNDNDLESILCSLGGTDEPLLEPPESVWAGIERELDGADASGTTAAHSSISDTSAVAEVEAVHSPESGDLPPDNVVPFRRPRRNVILAAAAAALLIAGIAGYAALRSGDDALEREVVASVDLDSAGLQVPNSASGVARLVQADDDRWEVELQVDDLEASGLDPADDDITLELWVLAPDATDMHSIGVLDASSADNGRFALPAGVEPADFPIVDISLEPDDGDPTHSGQSLLRGELTF